MVILLVLIGIPVVTDQGMKSKISQHFGRATYYAIINEDDNSIKMIQNSSNHFGGPDSPPELLQSNGVDRMLCSGLGRKAIEKFESYGIEVFVGANNDIETSLNLYKEGKLQVATDEHACKDARH